MARADPYKPRTEVRGLYSSCGQSHARSGAATDLPGLRAVTVVVCAGAKFMNPPGFFSPDPLPRDLG